MDMIKKIILCTLLCTLCSIEGESFTLPKTAVSQKKAVKKVSAEDVLHQSGVTITSIASTVEKLSQLQKAIIEMSEQCAESGNAGTRSVTHERLLSIEFDMQQIMLEVEDTLATVKKSA